MRCSRITDLSGVIIGMVLPSDTVRYVPLWPGMRTLSSFVFLPVHVGNGQKHANDVRSGNAVVAKGEGEAQICVAHWAIVGVVVWG